MGAVGLQTHIWSNNVKSALLLAGLPVLLLGMVYAGQLGLMATGYLPATDSLAGDLRQSLLMLGATAPLAFIGAGGWFTVALFAHGAIVDLAVGAKKVERTTQPELYNLLENLAISRGLPTPELRIIETDSLNAFASGLSEKKAVVGVTRGLLNELTRDELECVLAHELTHIINRDTRLILIATVFAGIISVLAEALVRGPLRYARPSGRSSSKGKGGGAVLVLILIAVLAAALAYFLSAVIRAALSRRREFLADAGAVELTKNPDAMISALRKISGRAQMEAPDEIRAMFLENREEHGFNALMATHPRIEKRIEALVRYAGGRESAAEEADPFSSAAAPARTGFGRRPRRA
jgi:heat shock protein HtpX